MPDDPAEIGSSAPRGAQKALPPTSPPSRAAKLAYAVCLGAILLVNHEAILAREASLGDDNAYLFLVGAVQGASAAQKAWLADVDRTIEAMPLDPERLRAYEARCDDRSRYPLAAVWYAAAQAASRPSSPQALRDGYREFVGRSLILGFRLAFWCAAAWLIAVLVVWANATWWSAVLLGLAAIGALDHLGWTKTHLIGSGGTPLGELVEKSLALLVDPTDPYSVFGFTSRSTFALALLAVVFLRGVGRRGLAYAVLGATGLFHLRYLALFGAVFAAGDLARFALASVGALREPNSDAARVARDQAILLLAVVASVVAVRVVHRFGDPFDVPLVWQDLTLRLLTVWQPALVVAAAYLALAYLARSAGAHFGDAQRVVPAAVAIALILPTAWRLPGFDVPRLRIVDGAGSREGDMREPVSTLSYSDQAKLFYAQAKTIHLGEDFVRNLFPDTSLPPAPAAAPKPAPRAAAGERSLDPFGDS